VRGRTGAAKCRSGLSAREVFADCSSIITALTPHRFSSAAKASPDGPAPTIRILFSALTSSMRPRHLFRERTVLWSYNKGSRHVAAAITASLLCPQRQTSSASSSHDRAHAFHNCRRAAIDYKSFATTSNLILDQRWNSIPTERRPLDVRFWSETDIQTTSADVRFSSESGQ
jgi:hypothetical protein